MPQAEPLPELLQRLQDTIMQLHAAAAVRQGLGSNVQTGAEVAQVLSTAAHSSTYAVRPAAAENVEREGQRLHTTGNSTQQRHDVTTSTFDHPRGRYLHHLL